MTKELATIEDLFEFSVYHPSEIADILNAAKELLTIQSIRKVKGLEERSQRDELTDTHGAHNRIFLMKRYSTNFNSTYNTKHPLHLP